MKGNRLSHSLWQCERTIGAKFRDYAEMEMVGLHGLSLKKSTVSMGIGN